MSINGETSRGPMRVQVGAWHSSAISVYANVMPELILLRHGESQWNLENRFTGWVDIPLTDKGRAEARAAGLLIREIPLDRAFTSVLVRATETLDLALEAAGQPGIPTERDKALNERMY